jgi:Rod binding domain-containing protein
MDAHHTARRIRNILADGGTIDGALGAPSAPRAARPAAPNTIDGTLRPNANNPPAAADSQLVAQRLEGVMLSSVVGRMREAANAHFFGENAGAQVYEGVFDQMMGDALAAGRGVGLYKEIDASIRRTQGANTNNPPALHGTTLR